MPGSIRRRKQSQGAMDSSVFSDELSFKVYKEIEPSYLQQVRLACRRFTVNFWYNILGFYEDHPTINRSLPWIAITGCVAFVITLIFFSITLEPRWTNLSPWYIHLHNAWLEDHHIKETTWILDEQAQSHTSNEPFLVGHVMLQFPQLNGKVKLPLKDVEFDPKSHYGIISKAKLERDSSVRVSNLYSSGGTGSRLMGMEFDGKDIVAITWGDRGSFLLRAWIPKKCEYVIPWVRQVCLQWTGQEEIPAETMRELVDKPRILPHTVDDYMKRAASLQQERDWENAFVKAQEQKKDVWGFFGWVENLFGRSFCKQLIWKEAE